MKTLGIETSCDETAIAIYDSKHGIIGESVHSQMDMHAEYGGVVPELASRDHCLKIVDVLEDALGNLSLDSIDQIAYTSGPGLLGALLIWRKFCSRTFNSSQYALDTNKPFRGTFDVTNDGIP